MKLAIVRQRYNPYGGAERFVERALLALAGQGADITLITRNWEGAPRADFHQVTCDPPYSRLFGGRTSRDRTFAAAVQAEMTRGAYDIVQSHERVPGCTIFRAGDGVHAAWLDHRRRGLAPRSRLAEQWSPYHRYILQAERAMLRHPQLRAVICNSHMVADEMARYYGMPTDRLVVIYNGVDTEVFHPDLVARHRASLRASLGIGAAVPLLLFVGSGFARKGVPQLLRALAAMRERETQLVVVGADRKLATLRHLAGTLGLQQRVIFTGPVGDVKPYYGAADGFVLPTFYDPCPNAVLEAMACGLPVVTTTACGAQEWIRDGENGSVVAAGAEEELVNALDRLVTLAGQATAHARARAAVSELTLEAMARRLLDLYPRLLAQPGAGSA